MAKLYIRRNGEFGSSCDQIADTGHHIIEDSGRFTVISVHGDHQICVDASRSEAEAAIDRDWKADSKAHLIAGL